ncbi:hypothetical protein B0H13DRAFT_1856288 [Mycena leptocephala]|nr:hypothetical protein B0H13DRAFT_1856288 [Mycena leptocephala]
MTEKEFHMSRRSALLATSTGMNLSDELGEDDARWARTTFMYGLTCTRLEKDEHCGKNRLESQEIVKQLPTNTIKYSTLVLPQWIGDPGPANYHQLPGFPTSSEVDGLVEFWSNLLPPLLMFHLHIDTRTLRLLPPLFRLHQCRRTAVAEKITEKWVRDFGAASVGHISDKMPVPLQLLQRLQAQGGQWQRFGSDENGERVLTLSDILTERGVIPKQMEPTLGVRKDLLVVEEACVDHNEVELQGLISSSARVFLERVHGQNTGYCLDNALDGIASITEVVHSEFDDQGKALSE